MDLATIVSQLKSERDRIDRAIVALDASSIDSKSTSRERGKGRMSAAGRLRISEMMKKRWAERRKRVGAKGK